MPTFPLLDLNNPHQTWIDYTEHEEHRWLGFKPNEDLPLGSGEEGEGGGFGLVTPLEGMVADIGDWFAGKGEEAAEFLGDTGQKMADLWDKTWADMGSWWDASMSGIGSWWDSSLAGIGSWWDASMSGIGDWWDSVWGGVSKWFEKYKWWMLLIILLLLGVGAAGYGFSKRR
jgi:hypothetical protein